jgi:hypothetical protein
LKFCANLFSAKPKSFLNGVRRWLSTSVLEFWLISELIMVNFAVLDAPRGGRLSRNNENSKGHDPLIEERLQRERPCRTLFIRNIKVSKTPTLGRDNRNTYLTI